MTCSLTKFTFNTTDCVKQETQAVTPGIDGLFYHTCVKLTMKDTEYVRGKKMAVGSLLLSSIKLSSLWPKPSLLY